MLFQHRDLFVEMIFLVIVKIVDGDEICKSIVSSDGQTLDQSTQFWSPVIDITRNEK